MTDKSSRKQRSSSPGFKNVKAGVISKTLGLKIAELGEPEKAKERLRAGGYSIPKENHLAVNQLSYHSGNADGCVYCKRDQQRLQRMTPDEAELSKDVDAVSKKFDSGVYPALVIDASIMGKEYVLVYSRTPGFSPWVVSKNLFLKTPRGLYYDKCPELHLGKVNGRLIPPLTIKDKEGKMIKLPVEQAETESKRLLSTGTASYYKAEAERLAKESKAVVPDKISKPPKKKVLNESKDSNPTVTPGKVETKADPAPSSPSANTITSTPPKTPEPSTDEEEN